PTAPRYPRWAARPWPTPNPTPTASATPSAPCSTTTPGGTGSPTPATTGRRSSPGPPRPRRTWLATVARPNRPPLTQAPCSLFSHAARTTRGDCPRRGPRHPAATADPVRAQAPAAHRGRAVPGPPAGPGGGRRRHPRGPGHLLQGGDVRRGTRGRRGLRAVDRLRAGGTAAGHRGRHPQRGPVPAWQRPGRPGGGAELRHLVRARPDRADRPARQDRRRGDAPPGRGGGPVPVRGGADRRDRPGHRVPGEDAGTGDEPDQRGLLRVPPRGDRPDPGRAPGVG